MSNLYLSLAQLGRLLTSVLRALWTLLTLVGAAIRPYLVPAIAGLLAYFLIPLALSRYNDVKSIQEARLARAVKFGDRNAEFVSRIHSEGTLLRMFADRNERMNLSGNALKEARRDLVENYRKQYLEIDATEWWWPREFAREVRALNLLAPEEMTQLEAYIRAYSESSNQTIYQPIYLWQFLDSPKYKVCRKKSVDEIKRLEGNIDNAFVPEYDKRDELVKKITALFAQSNFRTGWRNIIGIPTSEPKSQV